MEKKEMLANLIDFYTSGNKAKFAQRVGVSPQAVSTWLTRNTFDTELIHRTCREVSPEWLLSGEGSMLRGKGEPLPVEGGIPLLPITAWAGALTEDIQVLPHECETVTVPTFQDANFLIPVSGTSMMPTYLPGDIVACRRIEPTWWQYGRAYVLDTTQGAILKRVYEGEKGSLLKIVSDNEQYKPFELPRKDVRAAYLVLGMIRRE